MASGPIAPPAARVQATTRRRDVSRGIWLGVRVVAGMLSLAIVLGTGLAWAKYRQLESGITRSNALPAASASASASDAAPVVNDGKDQNIVLVGKDDRSTATDAQLAELGTERDGGSILTDTMMIMHIPADGSKATLISFPRDSWVSIPGYGKSKLNAAYGYGSNYGANPDAGRQLLIQTLQNMTGLTIDHYVEVDLIGFYDISNAIGGVQINLCAAQQDDYSGIDLPAGIQTIQGTQALAFVRQRHGLDAFGGDLAREKRQQYFLTQVFKKIQSAGVLLNYGKLTSLVSAVSSSLTMDQTLDPLQLAKQMANLTAGNITYATIPTLGTGTSSDGQSIVNVDTAGMADFIAQVIGTATDPTLAGAATVAPSAVTVDVLNGAGVQGIAATNAAALTALGFDVGTVTDGTTTSSTTIRYPDGMQSQAKTLAAMVPGAVLVKTSTVTRVTLIIGANSVQVSSLTPPSSSAAGTSAAPAASDTTSTETRNGADDSCIN
jgi:LCP family protein required for cell wall assembly